MTKQCGWMRHSWMRCMTPFLACRTVFSGADHFDYCERCNYMSYWHGVGESRSDRIHIDSLTPKEKETILELVQLQKEENGGICRICRTNKRQYPFFLCYDCRSKI